MVSEYSTLVQFQSGTRNFVLYIITLVSFIANAKPINEYVFPVFGSIGLFGNLEIIVGMASQT